MTRRPLLTLAIALVLAEAALAAVTRLRIDTSLASLFDRNDPSAAALLRVMNNFRSVEELLILAESDSVEPEKLLSFAQRLDEAIKADPAAAAMCDGVIYRVDAQQRKFFEQVLVPAGLFYLDDAAFEAAKQRLTREKMLEQFRRNESMISAPGPAADALAKVLLKDPLRLHEFLLEHVAASKPFQTYQGSDAFLSADGKALLIRVRGRRPVNDLEFAKGFTARIGAIADRLNVDHLRLELSGAYAIAAASERAIRRDMIESVIGSVIGLQLLFVLAYRRPVRSFLLAFAPVGVGVLYGFGAYALVSRQLTPMTAVIGGVLAGMSIDYAIAFLAYYQTIRASAPSPVDAAQATRRRVGTAILAAWATSIMGFVAVAFSRVGALRDFAILGALGLTGAFVCAIWLLPALLVLFDRRGVIAASSIQRRTVLALLGALTHRPRGWLFAASFAFGACVTILLLPGPLLPLESDLSVMHPRPNPPLEAQDHIAARMGTSAGSYIVSLRADDPDQLLRLAHLVDARLRSAQVKETGIAGTFGLATLLPDPAKGQARIDATGAAVADRVVADFDAAVAQTLFDPAAYKPYTQFLRVLLTNTRPPGVPDLLRYPSLADNILPASSLAPAGPSPPTEAITLVLLRQGNQRREARDESVRTVRAALADLPGATLTGLSVINHDTELAVRRDLPRLVFAAVAVAMLYLIVQFRNVVDCVLAMLPALFGLACLLAFMRLTGQKLNMINLIAFPLLVGIDVDYGIFLTMAVRRRELRGLGAGELLDRLYPASAAVLLCAAATTLGFGSLAFTSIPAVQSLGVAVMVGVASCVAGTFFLVIPILLLIARQKDAAAE